MTSKLLLFRSMVSHTRSPGLCSLKRLTMSVMESTVSPSTATITSPLADDRRKEAPRRLAAAAGLPLITRLTYIPVSVVRLSASETSLVTGTPDMPSQGRLNSPFSLRAGRILLTVLEGIAYPTPICTDDLISTEEVTPNHLTFRVQ